MKIFAKRIGFNNVFKSMFDICYVHDPRYLYNLGKDI